MAKIKVQVAEDAWEESENQDAIEPPKPGVYLCEIAEINSGYSVDENTKKPDKSRPRFEVIYRIIDPKAKTRGNDGGSALNARLWQYVTFGSSTQWKLANWLRALGIPFKKTEKGLEFEIDTAKYAAKIADSDARTLKLKPAKETGHPGVKVRVKVKPGANQSGEYRAEVGSVFPPKDDDDESPLEDEFASAEGDSSNEGEMLDDESGESSEESQGYTEDDLKAMETAELKEVVVQFNEAGYEISIKGKKKSQVIAEILEAQKQAFESAEGEPEGDEGMMEDDDDFAEEDDSEKHTFGSLKAMELDDLKRVAQSFDIKISGKRRSQVIQEILTAQASDDSSDPNENPF